ncbi:glucose PTS transporter subunit IIA [Selenomonas flueggei]|uniref:PTS system sucrose-specific IIBC component n=1 Tax=Selenomonas flueggei ATCC 43531 TaxID=638302 RepID=C4V5N2_9FIRM|nr:glucose PTS transporter subunit IIA [Selenomonas flueggei]EEQ47897.1 PTS system sucrose-specific IIBC component [Selenomonas flueggei ATCC 43531]
MQDIRLDSPLHGRLIPLSEVTDPAFASGAMGRGAAVADPEGRVVSPVDGEVTVLFATKHAIGIHSADGVDLLIHVGVDTVKLEGKHFTSHVAQGDTVQKGQLLLEFDPDAIRAEGYETTTPVLVTNAADYGKITFTLDGAEISSGDDAEEDGAPQEEHSTAAGAEIDPNLPKEERVAKLIWKYVGGAGNVRSAEHCATRLRLIVNDKTLIDEKAIENIDGVKGQFFAAAQYQIILGTGFVDKVYDAFIAGTNLAAAAASGKQEAYEQMTPLQKVSRTLGDVFVPVIPVLVATGLFMGLRGMAQSLGIGMNENLIRMSQILTDTAFAFLPALVCWSTMNRFGGTPVIGIVLGLMLVAPQLPNAYAIAAGDAVPLSMEIFGIPIPVVGYQGSVLPALVLGIFAARLQKWFKTFVPDIVDLIVTPFLTLLVSMLLGLLVIGPIMHTLEIVIFGAVRTFLELPYGIGGFVVGGLHQVIVVFGVHHVFNALEVQLLASTGVDPFNAIITGAIVAQGGAAVAVAARTHNAKKRALYISSAVPAFLGITEPAIFGINLRFMRPFICGLAGGACAGAAAGFLHLAGTGMGITVLPGTLLYLDHLPAYILVNIVGFAVAFGLTFVTFRPEE